MSQVTIDGGSAIPVASSLYGTCDTAAETAEKTVVCPSFDNLIAGVTVHIKFTYSNTAANATMNVNATGARPIYRYGTTAPGTTVPTSWQAGSIISFTYDGNNWVMNGWLNDTESISFDTVTIGSSSEGTTIAADEITDWNAGTASTASVSQGVLSIVNGAVPTLGHTPKTIPNISVSQVTVLRENT